MAKQALIHPVTPPAQKLWRVPSQRRSREDARPPRLCGKFGGAASREIPAHPPRHFLSCGITSPGGTTALEVRPRGGGEEDGIPLSTLHTKAPRSYVNNPR